VQWVVVDPRHDGAGPAPSDAAATPAVSVAPVDEPTAPAQYDEPEPAPVIAQMVTDEHYQDDCVITQPKYPPVSGLTIYHWVS